MLNSPSLAKLETCSSATKSAGKYTKTFVIPYRSRVRWSVGESSKSVQRNHFCPSTWRAFWGPAKFGRSSFLGSKSAGLAPALMRATLNPCATSQEEKSPWKPEKTLPSTNKSHQARERASTTHLSGTSWQEQASRSRASKCSQSALATFFLPCFFKLPKCRQLGWATSGSPLVWSRCISPGSELVSDA